MNNCLPLQWLKQTQVRNESIFLTCCMVWQEDRASPLPSLNNLHEHHPSLSAIKKHNCFNISYFHFDMSCSQDKFPSAGYNLPTNGKTTLAWPAIAAALQTRVLKPALRQFSSCFFKSDLWIPVLSLSVCPCNSFEPSASEGLSSERMKKKIKSELLMRLLNNEEHGIQQQGFRSLQIPQYLPFRMKRQGQTWQ